MASRHSPALAKFAIVSQLLQRPVRAAATSVRSLELVTTVGGIVGTVYMVKMRKKQMDQVTQP